MDCNKAWRSSIAHSLYVWGVPTFISGFVAAGVAGVIWQAILTVVDYFWFFPFFKSYEKQVLAEEAGESEA